MLFHGRECYGNRQIRRYDLIGKFRGECPAWVDMPPEAAWRSDRGQVGTATDAEAQAGIAAADESNSVNSGSVKP